MKPVITLFIAAAMAVLPLQAAQAKATASSAQTSQPTADSQSPRDVIKQAVDQITQLIAANRDKLENDPDYAAKLVKNQLADKVAFKRIARLVMGEKWFGKATMKQKYHFLDVFKNSLIDTYASGMALYDGQKIVVLPMRPEDKKGNRARVRMTMTTGDGDVIPISYTMTQQDGQWLVQNIIVNGLNMGQTFHQQFNQLASKYQGDIDKVISAWAGEVKGPEKLKEMTKKGGDGNDKAAN